MTCRSRSRAAGSPFIAIVVCLLALATTATGSRPAHKGERQQIIKAVGARGCEVGSVRVSTVSGRWGIFVFGYAPGQDSFSCPNVPTGAAFVHKGHGRWTVKATGSDFDCSTKALPSKRIQKDLGYRCHRVG